MSRQRIFHFFYLYCRILIDSVVLVWWIYSTYYRSSEKLTKLLDEGWVLCDESALKESVQALTKLKNFYSEVCHFHNIGIFPFTTELLPDMRSRLDGLRKELKGHIDRFERTGDKSTLGGDGEYYYKIFY